MCSIKPALQIPGKPTPHERRFFENCSQKLRYQSFTWSQNSRVFWSIVLSIFTYGICDQIIRPEFGFNGQFLRYFHIRVGIFTQRYSKIFTEGFFFYLEEKNTRPIRSCRRDLGHPVFLTLLVSRLNKVICETVVSLFETLNGLFTWIPIPIPKLSGTVTQLNNCEKPQGGGVLPLFFKTM